MIYFQILLAFLSLASFVHAAPPQTINDIFNGFAEGNASGLFPTLVLIALVTFLVGVVGFVRAGDDTEKRAAGRKIMTYGVVILFVMISYWGFVDILSYTFFEKNATLPNALPMLQNN